MTSPLVVAVAALLAAEPLHLAVPEVQAPEVSPSKRQFFGEHLASALTQQGAKVSTPETLAQIIGQQRQRELLGCDTKGTSCLAELAAALGGDGLALTRLAMVDGRFRLDLKLVSGADGSVLVSHQADVATETELLEALSEGAAVIVERGNVVFHKGEPRPTRNLKPWAWVPAAVGGAALIAGGVTFGLSRGELGAIPSQPGSTPIELTEAQAHAASGKALQGAGVGLLVTGAVLIAAAGAWFFLAPDGAPAVTVVPGPGGAALVLGGSF